MSNDRTEYLRRNLLHAASVGARENTRVAIARLQKRRRRIQWLEDLLAGVLERAGRVSHEMAVHRDEVKP